jgi:hypothetical protein
MRRDSNRRLPRYRQLPHLPLFQQQRPQHRRLPRHYQFRRLHLLLFRH